jgi:hypothetical protein
MAMCGSQHSVFHSVNMDLHVQVVSMNLVHMLCTVPARHTAAIACLQEQLVLLTAD